MSPNTVTDLASSFVQMAKAFEELPEVKRELEHAIDDNQHCLKTIQDREESILKLKAEVEQHLATIRSLEVARDDAELRFLELDEKSHKALEVLDWLSHNAAEAKDILTPPKPQEPVMQAQPVDPKPEPEPFTAEEALADPSKRHDMFPEPEYYEKAPVAMSGDPSNVDSWASGPGQSASPPMSASTGSEPLETVHTSNASEADSASGTTITEPKPPGRYSGKRYYEWSTYVPLHQWLAEGGTEADYNWRPAHPNAAF